MKRGTQVAVCHDGKWGRRVRGVVTDTRRGHHVKVKFPHPETGEDVEFWARLLPADRYNYKRFGGWADIDYWCPWYSVYKWSDK